MVANAIIPLVGLSPLEEPGAPPKMHPSDLKGRVMTRGSGFFDGPTFFFFHFRQAPGWAASLPSELSPPQLAW